ncbi:Scn8a, partial [Symbiodinium sp. CCMP2456]
MSETSSGWSPDIHEFNPDEPVLEVEAEDIQIHAFQRSNLQSWQRAVTLQELLTIRSDLPRLCHGWRSERSGHHLVPEKLNLYDFASRLLTGSRAARHRGSGSVWAPIRLSFCCGPAVSEDASLPRAIAIVRQVQENRSDGSPCLDLLVDLKRGRFLAGPGAPPLRLAREGGDWAPEGHMQWGQYELQGHVRQYGIAATGGESRSSSSRRVASATQKFGTSWCGYANRQHELDQEISVDVASTSFNAALRSAQGLLLILDPKATPFSRIWCDFELYTAIMSRDMGLDIVTTIPARHGREAETRMLSKDLVPGESAVAKSVREQNFPINLLAHGLEVMLENGMATQEEDKRAILKAIATENFEPGPGKPHVSNELRANMTLHSTLAILAWPQAMNRDQLKYGKENDKLDVEGALRSDVTRDSVELSLAHFEKTCVDA